MNARTRQSLRWSACLVRGGPGAVLSQALNVRCENSADDRLGPTGARQPSARMISGERAMQMAYLDPIRSVSLSRP